ncbi:MAG: hypothetical protein RL685_2139 [Pseudomonadota bacterium]|jgi:hypothetical protein
MKKQKQGKVESTQTKPRTASKVPPQVLHTPSETPVPSSSTRPRNSEQVAIGAGSSTAGLSWSAPASAAAAKCQQIYLAAHTADPSGRIHLDTTRLAQSLAEAGIGPLAEQALYSLSLLAAADGHSALFEEDVLQAIAKAS